MYRILREAEASRGYLLKTSAASNKRPRAIAELQIRPRPSAISVHIATNITAITVKKMNSGFLKTSIVVVLWAMGAEAPCPVLTYLEP